MKMDVFKTDQKVNIHLGYLSKKMCQQELSKIAQSGHTAFLSHLSLNINIFLLFCDLEYQQQQQLLLLAVVEKGPRFLVELKARSVYKKQKVYCRQKSDSIVPLGLPTKGRIDCVVWPTTAQSPYLP